MSLEDLYTKKIAMVRRQRCYYAFENQQYFIFALYPPELQYYSNSISCYEGGWYAGKLMNLVAIDDKGNFYYRYSDGSIRYYQHAIKTETIIAKSVKTFLLGIEPENKNKFREINHAKN